MRSPLWKIAARDEKREIKGEKFSTSFGGLCLVMKIFIKENDSIHLCNEVFSLPAEEN